MPNNDKVYTKLAVFDYFFVLRPMLFFPGWSTMLAGYFIGQRDQIVFSIPQILELNFFSIGKMLLMLMLAIGACAVLNQLQDIESDRRNHKLFIIAEGKITFKQALLEILLLVVAAAGLAFDISFVLGVFILISVVVAGYMYSYRPFSFKDNPAASLASNAFMGWLAFAIGWVAAQILSWQILYDSLPYLFFNTALYLYTTLPDIDGDKQSHKKTLAVIWGVKPLLWIAFALYSGSLLAALCLNDRQALFFILLSMPFFIMTLIMKSAASAIRATKFSILFFSLAICLKLPFYFILMFGFYFFTRWYYKNRFQFNYPNFHGKG